MYDFKHIFFLCALIILVCWLPYYVSLSYGISVFDYNSPFDLNHTIRLAASLMYERKKEKHLQRGKKG